MSIRMSNDVKEQSLSQFLKRRLNDIIREHEQHIATGNLKDYPDYKRLCGIIEGLSLAEREMSDWKKRHEECE